MTDTSCEFIREIRKCLQSDPLKDIFTLSDCDRNCDIARNGYYGPLWDYSHLAMVNIKGKVIS